MVKVFIDYLYGITIIVKATIHLRTEMIRGPFSIIYEEGVDLLNRHSEILLL